MPSRKGEARKSGKSPHLLSEDGCKGACAVCTLRLTAGELEGVIDAARTGALPDERFAARESQPVSCCRVASPALLTTTHACQAQYGPVVDLFRIVKNILGLTKGSGGGLVVAQMCTTLRLQFGGHWLDTLIEVPRKKLCVLRC